MKPKLFPRSDKMLIKRRRKLISSHPNAVGLRHCRIYNSSEEGSEDLNQRIFLLQNELTQMRQRIDLIQGRLTDMGANLDRLDGRGLKVLNFLGWLFHVMLKPIRWMVHVWRWVKSRVILFFWKFLYRFCFAWVLLSGGGWRKIFRIIWNPRGLINYLSFIKNE